MAGAVVNGLMDALGRQAETQVRWVSGLSAGFSRRGFLDDGFGGIGGVGRGRQGGIGGVAAEKFFELAYFVA